MKILSFSAPSLRWHLNVKQCELSSGDFFTIWIKWNENFFVLISFMWFLSFQFKTMLMSLWSDEGIQTAFQRCIFYPLFYIWGILLTKQTFTFYWLCLCNGFVFALIFFQAKWIPADWLSAVFPKQCDRYVELS